MSATLQLKSVACQQPKVFDYTTVSCNNNKMNTLAMRLREARETAGYTQQDLAKKAGVRQQSLQKIESGLTHNPRKLQAIESILGLPPGYLLYGEERTSELPKPIIARCPVLSASEALNWPENKQQVSINNENRLASKVILSGACYAFKIPDDSMVNYLRSEGFQEGRYIIVDPELKPKPNDYVIAKIKDEEQMVFRKYINDAGNLRLKPLNTVSFGNIPFSSNIEIKGVVVAYLDLLV